jgi:hypothetical protein
MSPKSRGRRDSKRPSDRRRAQRRSRADDQSAATTRTGETLLTAILDLAPDVMKTASPLSAESYVSGLLGALWDAEARTGDDDFEIRTGHALVDRLSELATPYADLLVRGIAVVGLPPVADQARSHLANPLVAARATHLTDALGWADQLGQARFLSAMQLDHELGDTSQLVLTFGYADEPPHALFLLLDHTIGGLVTEAWIVEDGTGLVEHLTKEAAADGRLTLTQPDPADVRALVEPMFELTDAVTDPPVHEKFAGFRLIAQARVRSLPPDGVVPDPPAWSEQDQRDLIDDFLGSAEAEGLPREAAADVARELVEFGVTDHGRVLRVSPAKLELLLMGWLPRTGLLNPKHLPSLAEVVPAWVRYAARRTDLSPLSLRETLDAVPALATGAAEAYRDESRWSPERVTVERLLSDVDPETEDLDDVFARRTFAFARMPDAGFDPTDEAQVAALAAEEHPAELLATLPDPELHRSLHSIIGSQLWQGEPGEVWTTAKRLLDEGMDREEVLHALMFALARAGADNGSYEQELAALPASMRVGH